jgi:hypothetical protein
MLTRPYADVARGPRSGRGLRWATRPGEERVRRAVRGLGVVVGSSRRAGCRVGCAISRAVRGVGRERWCVRARELRRAHHSITLS